MTAADQGPHHRQRELHIGGSGAGSFDRRGGLGRFYELFGEAYETILMEISIELVV